MTQHVSVAVIGSGFAGLGTAIALKQSGRDDFVVLERASDVGGTWRDNSYPGCACDVPSHVYSFSFAPNPNWSHSFSRQPEIQAYLQKTARDYGVLPHVRFDCELLDARWDHSWSAEGRRVAVIGTGASAIQFVPKLQPEVEHLTLFQRTAPWVLPRRDRRISPLEKKAYARFPLLQKAMRGLIYAGRETNVVGFRYYRGVMRLAERMARKHLEQQVPDPVLRAKLTPHFTLGCKRVLLSNSYYPALSQPNAEVVTDRIVQVVPEGVVTEAADGSRTTHEVDTIVFGTGFHVTDPPVAQRISVDGVSLAEHWKGSGMQALHGLSVAGYPNLFFLVGPNTGLGHNSIVLMIEAQVGHVLKALDAMEGQGAIVARADVQEAYNLRLQRELAKTVWNQGGCQSWYLDEKGRNTTLWPGFTFTFMRELAAFDRDEYELLPRG